MPALDRVSVRSHMPGSVAIGTWPSPAGVVEDEVLVDLVGHHDHVVLDRQVGDHLQLVAGEHGAGRVVRGVEQDQLRRVGDRRAQLVEVGPEVGRPQGDRAATGAAHVEHRDVGVVVGLQHDHLVARVDEAEQRGGDGLGAAGGHHHLAVRVDGEAVVALLVARDRGPQRGDADARGVLVGTVLERRSAAAITDGGPSTSGNPWPRLIAPVRTASADISLNTVGGMWARRREGRVRHGRRTYETSPRRGPVGGAQDGLASRGPRDRGRWSRRRTASRAGHRLADRLGGSSARRRGLGLAGEADATSTRLAVDGHQAAEHVGPESGPPRSSLSASSRAGRSSRSSLHHLDNPSASRHADEVLARRVGHSRKARPAVSSFSLAAPPGHPRWAGAPDARAASGRVVTWRPGPTYT